MFELAVMQSEFKRLPAGRIAEQSDRRRPAAWPAAGILIHFSCDFIFYFPFLSLFQSVYPLFFLLFSCILFVCLSCSLSLSTRHRHYTCSDGSGQHTLRTLTRRRGAARRTRMHGGKAWVRRAYSAASNGWWNGVGSVLLEIGSWPTIRQSCLFVVCSFSRF